MAKEENIILPAAGLLGLVILFSAGGDNKPPPYVPGPGTEITPTQFIKRYWNDALYAQKVTTIPALVTITQGGIESGWGNHAPGNNFFGIKAGSTWTGPRQLLDTTEYINGKLVHVKDYFRVYANARESFIDHGRFFVLNPRYKGALPFVRNDIEFVRHISLPLINPAYATDPNYADKLISAMKLVVKILQSNHLI